MSSESEKPCKGKAGPNGCEFSVHQPISGRKIKVNQTGSDIDNEPNMETQRVSPPPPPAIISAIKDEYISESDDQDSNSTGSDANYSDILDKQWEVEEILDYVMDDFGHMYFVKWKDWDKKFNTWEPPSNLLNCDEELYRFYIKRKNEYKIALEKTKVIEIHGGKRRRIGPGIPDVPPDPRPLYVRIQEYFNMSDWSLDDEINEAYSIWKSKKLNSKSRWPISKINKYFDDAEERNLSNVEVQSFKHELVLQAMETKRLELPSNLKSWEMKINAITGGKPAVSVQNVVDLSGPPRGFKFVNDYVPGRDVTIPKDPVVGCDCGESSCYDQRKIKCCPKFAGYEYAYTRYRKINIQQGSPIYECNSKCKCGPNCPNRVVQDGKTDHKLAIFRTFDGRGWGLKTLKSIKKDSFVTLYVGEVIRSDEAEQRGKIYDETGCTYLFDLDFNDRENPLYSVDGTRFGNIAHFINHSCSPNLGVYAVWVDCLDPNLPKLAMFALKDIAKDEELTFDYNLRLNSKKTRSKKPQEEEEEDNQPLNKRTVCLCGSSKCRKYIFDV